MTQTWGCLKLGSPGGWTQALRAQLLVIKEDQVKLTRQLFFFFGLLMQQF